MLLPVKTLARPDDTTPKNAFSVFVESSGVLEHTGNLMRIAAPPGTARIDFVRDRLCGMLSGGARAILISLDPEIDSCSPRMVEMDGR